MFVLFEGIDTTGKTTQIEKLKEVFPTLVATKEPGGTELGREIRTILLEKDFKLSSNAEALLFLADRAEHYEKVVKPNEKKIVVSDRGFVSGLAYALTNNENIDLDFFVSLKKFALGGAFPQRIVFFKTTKELLLSRISKKAHDTIEQRGIDYLLRVQKNMEFIIKKLNLNYIILDAKDSIENLHVKIKGFIND
ncbi:MAG: dTMP kinase [Campylobacteraceae bacterium]